MYIRSASGDPFEIFESDILMPKKFGENTKKAAGNAKVPLYFSGIDS